jgi:hypothetical protein
MIQLSIKKIKKERKEKEKEKGKDINVFFVPIIWSFDKKFSEF